MEHRKILSAAEMRDSLKDFFSREKKDYLGQPLRTIFFNGERPNVTEISIVHVVSIKKYPPTEHLIPTYHHLG